MPRRHTTGWELLGFDADPTPGDPTRVLSASRSYAGIADDVERAYRLLNGRAVRNGEGVAMRELNSLIQDLPGKLRTTADSFRKVATAYSRYATTLLDAQDQLDQAIDRAADVHVTATHELPDPPAADATASEVADVQRRTRQVDAARTAMGAAQRLAADARALREDGTGSGWGSRQVERELRDAADSAIPDRDVWDRAVDFFDDVGEAIDEFMTEFPWLETALQIAVGILSIAFPVLGLILGAVMLLVQAWRMAATGNWDLTALAVSVLALAGGGIVRGIAALGRLGPVSTALSSAATRTGPMRAGITRATASLRGAGGRAATATNAAMTRVVGRRGAAAAREAAAEGGTEAAAEVAISLATGQPVTLGNVLSSAAEGAVTGAGGRGVADGVSRGGPDGTASPAPDAVGTTDPAAGGAADAPSSGGTTDPGDTPPAAGDPAAGSDAVTPRSGGRTDPGGTTENDRPWNPTQYDDVPPPTGSGGTPGGPPDNPPPTGGGDHPASPEDDGEGPADGDSDAGAEASPAPERSPAGDLVADGSEPAGRSSDTGAGNGSPIGRRSADPDAAPTSADRSGATRDADPPGTPAGRRDPGGEASSEPELESEARDDAPVQDAGEDGTVPHDADADTIDRTETPALADPTVLNDSAAEATDRAAEPADPDDPGEQLRAPDGDYTAATERAAELASPDVNPIAPGNRPLGVLRDPDGRPGELLTRENGLITHVGGRPIAEFTRDLTEQRAAHYRERRNHPHTRNDVGEVVAVVVDRSTGRIHEATNQQPDVGIDDPHPLLAERIKHMQRDPANRALPTNHAEVKAINELLRARNDPNLDSTALRDFQVDNYFPFKKPGLDPAPCCTNCTQIIEGVQSNPGWFDIDEETGKKKQRKGEIDAD